MLKVLIIGRTEWLYNTILNIKDIVDIVGIVSSKEAPEYKKSISDFKKIAIEMGVPFFESRFDNKEDLIGFITGLGALDLGVSVNHPFILSNDIIMKFRISLLNAHGGDLPRYRGNACQAWAILNGEEKIGLCIHKMEAGELDSGDIIGRSYFDVGINTKIQNVFMWFETEIPSLYEKVIKKLIKEPTYILEKQDEKNALRCYPRLPEDGLINWSKSASDIIRLINVSGSPFSGAYSYLNGEKVIIKDAEIILSEKLHLAEPGQVCEVESGSIIVSNGTSLIKINDFEVEGDFKKTSILKSTRVRFTW